MNLDSIEEIREVAAHIKEYTAKLIAPRRSDSIGR